MDVLARCDFCDWVLTRADAERLPAHMVNGALQAHIAVEHTPPDLPSQVVKLIAGAVSGDSGWSEIVTFCTRCWITGRGKVPALFVAGGESRCEQHARWWFGSEFTDHSGESDSPSETG